jgi:hypothetical protein
MLPTLADPKVVGQWIRRTAAPWPKNRSNHRLQLTFTLLIVFPQSRHESDIMVIQSGDVSVSEHDAKFGATSAHCHCR